MVSRAIPKQITETLASEVGYCCPDEGCDDPYLTFHHFAPTWAEGQNHKVEGMVALCKHHHDEADIGAYTKQQLYLLKQNKKREPIRGRFNWSREKTKFKCGNVTMTGCEGLLRLRDKPVIWFEKDGVSGHDTLSMKIFKNKIVAFSMEKNCWQIHDLNFKIEIKPKGHQIKIVSIDKQYEIDIRFKTSKIEPEQEMDCTLKLKIAGQCFPVVSGFTISNASAANCGYLFDIQ